MSSGLRHGWTTGACATAAAYTAPVTGEGVGTVTEPGHLDLRSGPSEVSTEWLGARVRDAGGLPELVAGVRAATTGLDVVVIDRGGTVVGRA